MQDLEIADVAGVPLTAAGVVDRVPRYGAARSHREVCEARHVLHSHDLQLSLDIVVRAAERRVLDLRIGRADEALDVSRCSQNAIAIRIGDIVHGQTAAGD